MHLDHAAASATRRTPCPALHPAVPTPSSRPAPSPALVRNGTANEVPRSERRPDPEQRLSGAAALEALLQGRPEARWIAPLLDGSANADGFPYPRFLMWLQGAYENCAPDDLPALQERVCQLLGDRARNGGFDPPVMRQFGAGVLGGVPWTALHKVAEALYGPQARMAMIVAQCASTVIPQLAQRPLQAALAAVQMLPIEALLPQLRSIEQVDQFIGSLPESLRASLSELHTTLTELEDAVVPAQPATLALLAVAAVLWKLHDSVLPPPPAVQGDAAGHVAALPQHARSALHVHRRLAALFAPVSGDAAWLKQVQEDIAAFAEMKHQLDHAAAENIDDNVAIGSLMELMQARLEEQRDQDPATANERPLRVLQNVVSGYIADVSPSTGLCAQLGVWLEEHLQTLRAAVPAPADTYDALDADPHVADALFPSGTAIPSADAGGAGVEPPDAGAGADPAAAREASNGAAGATHGPGGRWWSWAALALPAALRGVANHVDAEAAAHEQIALQPPPPQEPAEDTLESVLVVGAQAAQGAQRAVRTIAPPGFAARHPGAYTALVGLGGTAATFVAVRFGQMLWPESPESLPAPAHTPAPPHHAVSPASPAGVIEWPHAPMVDVGNGTWGSTLDLQLPHEQPVAARQQASPPGTAPSAAQAPTVEEGNPSDGEQDLLAVRNLAVAVAEDIAEHANLPWLRAAAESEKALYASALHDLREAGKAIEAARQQAAADLGGDARQQAAEMHQLLFKAAWCRLTLDAVEAKIRGVIGPGRSADTVLEFLKASPTVERARMFFSAVIDGGERVEVELPDYLILRRNTPGEPGHGEIVVYRVQSGSFRTFISQDSLRDYLNEERAKQDTLSEQDVPWSLSRDVLQAVPQQHLQAVRDLLADRDRRPTDWDLENNLRWEFAPVDNASLLGMTIALADQEQAREQQQAALAALQSSPKGLRLSRARQAWDQQINGLANFHDHARPAVQTYFRTILQHIDQEHGGSMDPDLVEIELNERVGDLTDWATHFWISRGIKRGALPGAGQWPSASELKGMRITVFRRGPEGTRSIDSALTEKLSWESNRRYFCRKLDDLVHGNKLGDAYRRYLEGIQGTPKEHQLAGGQAELAIASAQVMIEEARIRGALSGSACDALAAAAAQEGGGHRSPYRAVALDGIVIPGVWSLQAEGTDHVFVTEGPQGAQVMEAGTFQRWLERSNEAEAYIRQRALYDDHPRLAELFAGRRTSKGIPVTFQQTEGPLNEARKLLTHRLDNLDTLTTSQLERLGEALDVLGTVVATGACLIGSGGMAASLCLTGTLAIFARGVSEGVAAVEDGDRPRAAAAITGAVLDGIDVLDVTRIGALAFRVGKGAIGTVQDARRAMKTLHQQRHAFTDTGHVSSALTRVDLPAGRTPVLGGGSAPDWPVYTLDGKDYIRPAAGGFIEAPVDAQGIRRLKHAEDPQAPMAPVSFSQGAWQRLEGQPDPLLTTPDRIRELLPLARALDVPALRSLLAVHGVAHAGQLTATARSAIEQAGRRALIVRAGADADPMLLQGTAALAALWARTPRVNGGLRVDIVPPVNSGLPRVRLGQGDGPLLMLAPSALDTLTVQTLIERAGPAALRVRLGLAADASADVLQAEVVRHLQATLAQVQQAIGTDWERVLRALATPPNEMRVLRDHYPALSVAEATDALRRDEGLMTRLRRDEPIAAAMSVISARRHERRVRQNVLDGRISRLDEISALAVLLQDVFPGTTTRVLSDGPQIQLQLQRTGPAAGTKRPATIRFDASGAVQFRGSRGWQDAGDWKQALSAQLTDTERRLLADTPLQERLERAMAANPLEVSCLRSGKRSPCDVADPDLSVASPQPSVSLLAGPLKTRAHQARLASRAAARDAQNAELQRSYTAARELFSNVVADRLRALDSMELEPLKKLGRLYATIWQSTFTIDQYRSRLGEALTAWKENLAQWSDSKILDTAKRWKGGKGEALSAAQRTVLTQLDAAVKATTRDPYLLANIATVDASLVWEGTPIRISATYTSNPVVARYGTDIRPAIEPEHLVVKAHLKPGATLGDVPKSGDFYHVESELKGLMPGEYLHGMDAWPMGDIKEAPDGSLEFPAPKRMTAEGRAALASKPGFKQQTLEHIQDGEYYYEVGFRPCSEAAFFKELYDQLRKLDPVAFSPEHVAESLSRLEGHLDMYTETAPCGQVCRRRVSAFINGSPKATIRVGSSYIDVPAAKAYRSGGRLVDDVAIFEPDPAAGIADDLAD